MNQVKHTEEFKIYQPAEILFPLFSAEGEKKWVPGWDYINIMGTTALHEDYVFVTENHDHGSCDAIWLVKRHVPESYLIELYKIEPKVKVGIISIQCNSISKSETTVRVSYEYIALSEKGREFLAGFTGEEYRAFIGGWKQLLEQYFDGSS